MRRAVLGLLLLLPACLEYEITVTTVVQADGTITRKLAIRARDSGNPADAWKRLKVPGKPYKIEGDEEKGFVATAQLQPGRHPSGLGVLLGGLVDDDVDARRGFPAAEGTADVRKVDLIVGMLYRYEERVALGTDPARFGEELPRWLDTGLKLLIDALKLRFPDLDFAPVEARARAELLPALQQAIGNLYGAATGLMMEVEPVAVAAGAEPITSSRFWPLIVREFAAFGLKLPEDGEALQKTFETEQFDELFRPLLENLADRLVAPLPEAKRAEVRAALIESEGLEAQLEEAAKKLYPDDEAKKKVGRELASFAASALGGYVVYGIFDSFDMRFKVELPGRLVRTNGDLARPPAAEWRLGKEGRDLVIVPPQLYAYSFVPAKGAPDTWDLAALGRIQGALDNLGPDARAAVEIVVAGVLAGGAQDETGLDDQAQYACRVIWEALEQANERKGD